MNFGQPISIQRFTINTYVRGLANENFATQTTFKCTCTDPNSESYIFTNNNGLSSNSFTYSL